MSLSSVLACAFAVYVRRVWPLVARGLPGLFVVLPGLQVFNESCRLLNRDLGELVVLDSTFVSDVAFVDRPMEMVLSFHERRARHHHKAGEVPGIEPAEPLGDVPWVALWPHLQAVPARRSLLRAGLTRTV